MGLREITASAGVAQGSFTNHFASKEAFGVAILDHYFDRLRNVIGATLRDEGRPPLARLHAYFDAITALFADADWRYGCLAGNMGLKAAEHSEPIRVRLSEFFTEWTLPFADVIRQAQATGEISDRFDADEAGAAWGDAADEDRSHPGGARPVQAPDPSRPSRGPGAVMGRRSHETLGGPPRGLSVLAACMTVFGALAILAGSGDVVLGPHLLVLNGAKLGPAAGEPWLDSQLRLGAMWAGWGALMIWACRDLRARGHVFDILLAVLFVAGCGRALSALLHPGSPALLVFFAAPEIGGSIISVLLLRSLLGKPHRSSCPVVDDDTTIPRGQAPQR